MGFGRLIGFGLGEGDMNFGKINQYILFGGGQLLSFVAQQLQLKGFSVIVVTSERHSIETIEVSSR